MIRNDRRGAVGALSALSLVGIVFVLGLAGLALKDSGSDPPPPPVNSVFAGVLLRVGLSADALAASGVSAQQASALVAALQAQYDPATLASRDQAFVEAKQSRDRLARKVRSGLGGEADVTALARAETALTSATSARDGYLGTLRAAALGTVSPTVSAALQRIRANSGWGLPTQYLVKDRTEADWVALRDALATKRISEQDDEEEFAASAQSRLAAVDAEAEIAAAKVALDTNIAAVQTAWNSAAAD